VLKSIALFVLAALLEIGGAWLVWQGVREHRGWIWAGAGVIALGAYGFVAAFNPTRTSDECWPHTAASSSQARWPGE
jgi:drug/metabolite transporter superfamily protein YnfA